MVNQPAPQGETMKWLLIIVGVVVLLAAGYYAIYVSLDSMNVKPAKVLSEHFYLLTVDDVHNLRWGGAQAGHFDLWLRFSTDKSVRLLDPQGFTDQNPQEAQRWFMAPGRLQDDPGLQYPPNDFTLLHRQKENRDSIKLEWLLTNNKTHDYYYRYWGQ